MIKEFAPVLIITLNRFQHISKCVESLSNCIGADRTDLYIALDYPLNESHWEGYIQIKSFIGTITGFKSVNVINREVNFGIHKNYFESLSFVFETHDRLIFSEDDNVFSTDFLCFMNKCLEKFEYRNDIFSVNGYNYPINIPDGYSENVYLWQGNSAWGQGYWRKKFLKIDWSNEVVQTNVNFFLKDYINVFKFNAVANIYIPSLIHMQNLNIIHGDIYICLYQFLNNMTSVFPVESRVRNIGNDGSGENCSELEEDIYSTQSIFIGSSDYMISNVICSNREIDNILKMHFHKSFLNKVNTFFRLFLINIGLYTKLRILKAKFNG